MTVAGIHGRKIVRKTYGLLKEERSFENKNN
jgi:hypothetical protein